MELLNFILNLAALFLWLNWREARRMRKRSRYAQLLTRVTNTFSPWNWQHSSLLFLGLILSLRALLYLQLAQIIDWIPVLNAGPVSLPFRADYYFRLAIYSFLDFFWFFLSAYSIFLLLSALNEKKADTNPILKFIRSELGFLERWPASLKITVPFLIAFLFWFALSALLTELGIVPNLQSHSLRAQFSLILALSLLFAWRLFLLALFALDFVQNHVYLGRSPLWEFIHHTSRTLLQPVRVLPTKVQGIDFAPLLGIVFTLALTALGQRLLLAWYSRLQF